MMDCHCAACCLVSLTIQVKGVHVLCIKHMPRTARWPLEQRPPLPSCQWAAITPAQAGVMQAHVLCALQHAWLLTQSRHVDGLKSRWTATEGGA